jgi:hypothetical protein
MKMKKTTALVLATVLLLAAYAALGVFALAQDGEPVSAQTQSLDGVWRVVAYHQGDNMTLIPCEFMTFADGLATDYRDSFESPYVKSAFKKDGSKLVLSDLDRTYEINLAADHVLQLYTSPSEYMELVWYSSLDAVSDEFKTTQLEGTWNIAYRRGLDKIGTETLVFDSTTLTDYRNGSTEPTVCADYEWDAQNCLVVPKLAKIYKIYPASENEWFLVETDTGFVWDLVRGE